MSLRSDKPGSFGSWRAVVALVACLGAAGSGCIFSDGDEGGVYVPPVADPGPVDPLQVPIDADAKLVATAGEGVGVFVEYATGGHWNVFTSCDSNTPTNPAGAPCFFDLFVTVVDAGASISNPQGRSLEGKDAILLQSDGTVHLFTETSTGLNGMTFDTAPGAIVELDVWLDNVEDPHFVYWVGKDVLHQGAPTDPVDFVPNEVPVESPPKGP